MKRPREPLTEVVCPACDGTGFQKVKQPTQPGRKNLSAEMRGMSRQRPNKEVGGPLARVRFFDIGCTAVTRERVHQLEGGPERL
jgi:hypothetical protein